jgi:5-methylcytosine-specific restriction protein A
MLNLINRLLQRFVSYDAKRSSEWSKVRKNHLSKHPKCQCCGRDEDIEVHHIVPVHVDPSKELDDDNLISLCAKYCHFTVGHLMDWKSWNTNVVNDSEQYLEKIKNRPYHE